VLAATTAQADQSAHDYPTLARIEYVQECMNRAAAHQGTMYQCACAIDRIAEKLSYDAFVEASTYAKYSTLPGEDGGIFRDTDDAKQKAKLFRSIESDAWRVCNVPTRGK
jgi:hypothetical protein